MGSLILFPRSVSAPGGVVHAYPLEGGGFEIGHESSSGNSWGSFEQFDCPEAAAAAAYRLNREVYGNSCSVDLHTGLLAALPDTPGPDRGAF